MGESWQKLGGFRGVFLGQFSLTPRVNLHEVNEDNEER
jgi:hypothetical protein